MTTHCSMRQSPPPVVVVHVEVNENDGFATENYDCVWRYVPSRGWKLIYSHDGWQPLSLTAVRSYVT